MKKIINYFWILLPALLFVACSSENEIGDIEPWTEEYELPQGESDADERIVDYNKRFGTYIVYDYMYLDFHYEFGNGYFYELADPVYVGDMLNLLEEIWFDFYPDEFHRKYMPFKIMLAGYITYEDSWAGISSPYFMLSINSSSIGIGFCSDTLQKLSSATKLEFKNTLQKGLWLNWLSSMEFPDEFFNISDYSSAADVNDASSPNYARNRGFVADYSNGISDEWSSWAPLSEQYDLRSFLLGMVLRTSADWEEDLKWPLVKQKYDILRNWIQETYGFDLQNVGDATYEEECL